MSGCHASQIRRLLLAHGVLCFPAVALDDEEQLDFAKTLGHTPSRSSGIMQAEATRCFLARALALSKEWAATKGER